MIVLECGSLLALYVAASLLAAVGNTDANRRTSKDGSKVPWLKIERV